MTRSLTVLSKILGLTASSNPNEARAAEEKLEQQLKARGISREQLEATLDMSSVDEEIEAISFRYGKPYKRIDPVVSIIIEAVADYYNGQVVYTVNDEDGKYMRDYRQIEISAARSRKLEIEIYSSYLIQAVQDDWAKHCKEDPFKVAIEGAAYRNNFRKSWAYEVRSRFYQMKKSEEKNGRQIQTKSRTINQSALAVVNSNKTESAIVNEYFKNKYPSLRSGRGFTSENNNAGRAAGGSVGLSRQVASGSQKALSGY